MQKRKIVVAISGASGSIYAKALLDTLSKHNSNIEELAVVFSKSAEKIWKYELGSPFEDQSYPTFCFKRYSNDNLFAPFASGSAKFDTMIICPSSMGILGRIAHGASEDLIARAADVMLKERRKLILVPREAPYSLVHISNMKLLTEAGAIICPASPSFYSLPKNINELVFTVINRVLDLADIETPQKRWGNR